MGIYDKIVQNLLKTEKGRSELFLLAVGVSEEAKANQEEAISSTKKEFYLREAIDEAFRASTDDSEKAFVEHLQKILRSKEEQKCQMQQ